MTRWLIRVLEQTDPRARKLWAARVLLWSIVLMAANVGLYVGGVIDESSLILVTLVLSWLAVTATCVDVLMTTDVRDNED